ncbi:hypothetical protein EV424DRAFT_1350231 [Suillus variegatus]|nr:hypothetical protein EV424DRAFT_1350231 [Suillus variegatus]
MTSWLVFMRSLFPITQCTDFWFVVAITCALPFAESICHIWSMFELPTVWQPGLICEMCGSVFLHRVSPHSLSKAKIPWYSLANKLYRGHLPDRFSELTWVEEIMLYQPSDTSHLLLLHGNTCTHETNIISTVNVLPCTPADINGMLSVIFIGPDKMYPQSLNTIFHIHK